MKRVMGAAHAFFYHGKWRVNPRIAHPPFCVCKVCKVRRRDDEWDREFLIRIDRVAPIQTEARAISFAEEIKRSEEDRLQRMTTESRKELRAMGGRRTFGELCEAYRMYQRTEGKRLDRDKYRIEVIESYFGAARDPHSIQKTDLTKFRLWLTGERGCEAATVDRYLNTLLAILNGAVKDGLIRSHELMGVRRMRVKKRSRPKTFTRAQVEVMLGVGMERYEREQAEEMGTYGTGSRMPLRGLCLVAYRTLMRPSNNLALRWEQLSIDRDRLVGSFHLEHHKNASKGIEVEGPLAPSVLRYLIGIMPEERPTGLVHPNPMTGKPYVNIRQQWDRLIGIANEILPEAGRIGPEMDFYNWRHTGASQLAASGADPVMIVRMMGDTSLQTVLKHYFNSELTHMQRLVRRWEGSAGEDAGEAL